MKRQIERIIFSVLVGLAVSALVYLLILAGRPTRGQDFGPFYPGITTGLVSNFKAWNFAQWCTNANGQIPTGIWPSSCQVTNGMTNLFCSSMPFQPYMTNWVIMVSHAGGANNVTVNTNYPFGSNTKTFNNWFDAVGYVSNVLNPSNIVATCAFGITTNGPFVIAPNILTNFQNAWNFICTNPGNNELDIQEGIYGFEGPWQSTAAWTNHFTCLISTPHIQTTSPVKTVRVIGLSGSSTIVTGDPASIVGGRSMPNGPMGVTFAVAMYGTNNNLYSFIDTRDLTGPAIIGEGDINLPAPFGFTVSTTPVANQPYNGAKFDFQNFSFLVPYDHNFAVMNLFGDPKTYINNIGICDDMIQNPGDAEGGTNGWGILMPGSFNDSEQTAPVLGISGCYNGIGVGGNGNYGYLGIYYAWNAVVGISTANADTIGIANFQGVKNHFVSYNTLDIHCLCDMVQDTGPAWMSWPNLVIATNSCFILGDINYITESALTYVEPWPIWAGATPGTSNAHYLHVTGNDGTRGGVPTQWVEHNTPAMLDLVNCSNSITITGSVPGSGIDGGESLDIQNVSGNCTAYIDFRNWFFNQDVVRIACGGNTSSGNSINDPNGYDISFYAQHNGGYPMFAAWQDGSFHAMSNIVSQSSTFVYPSNGWPGLPFITNGLGPHDGVSTTSNSVPIYVKREGSGNFVNYYTGQTTP